MSWLSFLKKQKTTATVEEDEDAPAIFRHGSSVPDEIVSLVKKLSELAPMDKRTMSTRCDPETTRMENFMRQSFGFENINGEYFVQGVRAFQLRQPLSSFEEDGKQVITFGEGTNAWSCSVSELRQWQSSFIAYASDHVYETKADEGKQLIRKTLSGKSEAGHEAWCAKFLCRISVCPILCEFDARVIPRSVGDVTAGRVHLVSVSGVDFAGRHHDEKDITYYIPNYRDVYHMDGDHILTHARDFYPTGVKPKLDEAKLAHDLKLMARLRFRAQDELGIQVCVETGIGLGVFAGDRIGIGDKVRRITARCMREVLEEMEAEGKAKGRSTAFANIRLIIFALPIFRVHDNYEFFADAFASYKSDPPVLIMDQDMHRIARAVSQTHVVSELNPADSHGVVGEYWQNRGPGTEEKLALTTLALMTQHHVCNPHVLDMERYHIVDASPCKNDKTTSTTDKKK